MAIYLIQIFKFPFENIKALIFLPLVFYSIFLAFFLFNIITSIYNAYLILKPVDVAYINEPRFFYEKIKKQYETALATTNTAVLNEYIKATYLKELESAIEANSALYKEKSRYYYNAFTKGLLALVFYIFCSSFVILFAKNGIEKIEISNVKEIINKVDSVIKTNNHE
ncbi:MAG: hypothetical protein IPJ60_12770 [Sphingobacteriaceae bacterium]|nr:hypothetical protein [Sphingobacteriaceae bacterium]